MGTDYCVNVGPVIVINNPPRDTNERHVSCCNDKCVKFHRYSSGEKFCPECGSRIAEWFETVTKPLDVDFYELFKDERLVPSDFHSSSSSSTVILIANKEKDTKAANFQHFHLNYDGPFEVFPKIEEIGSNIEKFKQIFDSDLNKLKEIFGADNVEVRYGTVGTIS